MDDKMGSCKALLRLAHERVLPYGTTGDIKLQKIQPPH